jgi:RHH-type proline utilization regulon transcriptional repressor/proline dehydrogenase/delta 1-pyrroline-5-carboxylate dehydrogenase
MAPFDTSEERVRAVGGRIETPHTGRDQHGTDKQQERPLECIGLDPVGPTKIPPRPWAYGKFLLFGQAAALGGVDGSGKGSMAVTMALAMIIGLPLLGDKIWRKGPVAIISYEDDGAEWHRRIAAACAHHSVDYDLAIRNIHFLHKGRDKICFAAMGENGPVFQDGNAVIAAVLALRAAMLIIDPWNHAHRFADGNSNALMAQVAGEVNRTENETSAAVLVLHHLRKGATGEIDDLMGATSLRATFRSTRILKRMTDEEATALGVTNDAWRYSRISGSKTNYSPPADQATWFQLISVALDAARYLATYKGAIHAIGRAAAGRGIYDGPGISIKLSALHPRYCRAKRERVMDELLPRLTSLALLAKRYEIGLNIDAEEADRLELSLDLLEALALDPALAGWNGIGFVIQAYGKRCPFIVDWILDLARRAGRRIMVRLVKGAYWDTEIKRAQVDGLAGFPVFTRKIHTDVSYLACAQKLLAAPDAVFPQFATHNAQTVAAVMEMAGPNFRPGQYEFQCLHGMGEPLYEEVVGPGKLGRPCRIYAPVGTHETLLAYLVRRLLENGANASFVHRIADAGVSVGDLVADPVDLVRTKNPAGTSHERITLPRDLYGPERPNAMGLDLSNEDSLAALAAAVTESWAIRWTAHPAFAALGEGRPVLNPADHRDVVGHVQEIAPAQVGIVITAAVAAAPGWAATPVLERAMCLRRAADAMEARMPALIGLIVREAGKSFASAIAEVREAVDFLRYYAAEGVRTLSADAHRPLGPVACISPWNFPLAIFIGQTAAALAAGNTVLAKPAEETPLIAAEAVRLLYSAGVPADALQLLPGDGAVGAALIADSRVQGVIFTGSTAVAPLIQRQLAARLTAAGQPIPLIAETGGQNAMVVDSSALVEQVVGDVIASAFDSAGQRCSALRILCLQEDVAERMLAMLKRALRELEIGNPDRLSVDVGPVISAEARDSIERHVQTMRARGHAVEALPLPHETAHGTFVAARIIEINRVADVEHEVFGPVLHILRYRREELDRLIEEINASGFGLTFGLHTRLDETITRAVAQIRAGNIYINRNIVGAVVGVQPFGGSGLSGTGPKAGGPLYLGRLLNTPPQSALRGLQGCSNVLSLGRAYANWLRTRGHTAEAERCAGYLSRSAVGAEVVLPGPVGERNVYALRPRGLIAALGRTEAGLMVQVGAILATGNTVLLETSHPARGVLNDLPREIATAIHTAETLDDVRDLRGVLFEGDAEALLALDRRLAERDGPIIQVQAVTPAGLAAGDDYDLNRMLEECSISTNTAAAGGNASLMSIG